MIGLTPDRVSPFGHPGLTGCVRLPPAYRSLPRPSSPPYTQASPARSRSLDYSIRSKAKHAPTSLILRVTIFGNTKLLVLRERHSRIGFVNPTIYHTSVVNQRREAPGAAP